MADVQPNQPVPRRMHDEHEHTVTVTVNEQPVTA